MMSSIAPPRASASVDPGVTDLQAVTPALLSETVAALRAMDASDGLDTLPGFRPRPPDVGVAGSHSSEMLAVARTYPL